MAEVGRRRKGCWSAFQGPLFSFLLGISQGLATRQLAGPPASGLLALEPGKLHFHKESQEILMCL